MESMQTYMSVDPVLELISTPDIYKYIAAYLHMFWRWIRDDLEKQIMKWNLRSSLEITKL